MRISDLSSDVCSSDLSNMENARQAYLNTDLPAKLGRYHQDPDSAFWGWNDIWLDPEFRAWNIEPYINSIRCPILAIQGEQDEYGSIEQIRGIERRAPQTQTCILADRSEEHTSELQSLMRSSYAVFCLKKKTSTKTLK